MRHSVRGGAVVCVSDGGSLCLYHGALSRPLGQRDPGRHIGGAAGSLFLRDYAAVYAGGRPGERGGDRNLQAESVLYYGESAALLPAGADLYQ